MVPVVVERRSMNDTAPVEYMAELFTGGALRPQDRYVGSNSSAERVSPGCLLAPLEYPLYRVFLYWHVVAVKQRGPSFLTGAEEDSPSGMNLKSERSQ